MIYSDDGFRDFDNSLPLTESDLGYAAPADVLTDVHGRVLKEVFE